MNMASDLSVDALRRLSERLFSLGKGHGHVLALIDRFNPVPEEIAASIQEAPLGDEEQSALHDPIFGEAGQLAPQLLRLTVQHMALLDVLAGAAVRAAMDPEQPEACMCGFLVAPAQPVGRVAAHLSRQFDPVTHDGRKIFLRFHDPRVLPRLWDVLDAEQQGNLLGPIARWILVRRDGEIAELQASGAKVDGRRVRLSLTERVLNDALRIEALNLSLRSLRMGGHVVPLGDDDKIVRAIAQAQDLGLVTIEDLAAYAALAWLWPEGPEAMKAHGQVIAGVSLAQKGVPFRDYASERLLPIIPSDSKL
ncbi:DUF4123 domain-containing protein [Acidovorax cavernicola]|uniref:DUF4123 domain-containing protein n=1 Tax=Acidovorax cavernicola TaxID=1675792 RepID=A0A9X8D429_9BURK|nr:DUF4123 domain-containing protein [Acidovorax cavernicola]RIX78363.1 DUF4123 domain-containing protein [Acidovorax cavernicola]